MCFCQRDRETEEEDKQYVYLSALNSKSLCAAVLLSAHELLQCREAEEKTTFHYLLSLFNIE